MHSLGPVPFETESLPEVRSPQGPSSGGVPLPDTNSTIEMSPNNASNVSQSSTEASDATDQAGDGVSEGDVQGAAGRVDEVPAVQPGDDTERAVEAGDQAVHTGKRPVAGPLSGAGGVGTRGQMVSTPMGIFSAEQLASLMPQKAAPVPAEGTHGKVHAQHGVHAEGPKPAAYTCEDCLDLERRIRKAFKEQGYQF